MATKDTLHIGQKLVIWKKGKQGSIIRTVYYQIRTGDTIGEIAQKFKVNNQDVIKWNSLNQEKYLKPGQKLTLHIDVTKVSV